MSLVENLINQISTQGLNGITNPLGGFDLNDDTFAKLLDKQLNSINETAPTNFVGTMGAPAGLMIEPIDGVEFAEAAQDQMELLGENKFSREEYVNQPIEFKELDFGDYFSNLLKTGTEAGSDFMNFARKQATGFYEMQAKDFVFDTKEFIQGVLNT